MGLLTRAIHNNAELCELVAWSHGIASQRLKGAWVSTEPMPPFYPNVVSLEPAIQCEEVSLFVEDLPTHCGWKDSFADHSLEAFGFSV